VELGTIQNAGGAETPTAREENAALTRPTNGAGEGTRTPNLLFLCGWYRRALAGWHRLASGLVRPRKDTHCLRSSSDRWAGKCGGKCGVSASDRLCVSDVHVCDDSFRVRAEPPSGNAAEGGVWSVHGRLCLPPCGVVGREFGRQCNREQQVAKWPAQPRFWWKPLLVIACEMPSGSESRGITADVCGVRCQTRLPDADPAFNQALGEFRAAVGTQLAHIAAAFGLDVEEPLSSILPAPDQDADTASPRTPREIIERSRLER
jgi:hypothetical protein